MKKIITLLFAVVASVGMMSAIEYSGSCGINGDNLLWTVDIDNNVLTISGTGDMADFESLSAPWQDYSSSAKYVIIGEGVTSIGNYAFSYHNIKSITIPSGVTKIGEGAFNDCRYLPSIVLPNINDIQAFAFTNCRALTSIEIPNSVKRIRSYAFSKCSGLTTLVIPESVTRIDSWAFNQCSGLTSVTLPASVSILGDNIFYQCTSLTSFVNHATEPQTINIDFFADINLSSCTLYVPKESIDAYHEADVWKEFGAIKAIGDEPEPCLIASGTCGENMTWKLDCDSVLTISGTGAMDDYNYFAPWTSEYRFSIKSVVIQDGVTSIGNTAFANFPNIIAVTIPESIQRIGDAAFFHSFLTSTASIEIPNSVTTIGQNAFSNCDSLISIHVAADNSYYSSEDGVLFNKDKTTLVQYPGGKEGSYTIPNSVIYCTNGAFGACHNLMAISIPNSVASMGEYPFSGCSGLTMIDVAADNSYYSSEDGVLFNKDKTTIIKYPGGKQGAYTIPSGVTNCLDGAFSSCFGLTAVTVPSNVISLGSSPFSECGVLASIDVATDNPNYSSEDGVLFNKEKTILIMCQGGRKGAYIIPENVIYLEEKAFWYCKGITSVTIPNNVKNIASPNFTGCTGLVNVTNYATEPQEMSDGFGDVNLPACTLYVPEGSLEAYKNAYLWKEFGAIKAIGEEPEEQGCIDYLNLENAVCYINNSQPTNTKTFNDFTAVPAVNNGPSASSSRHTIHTDLDETDLRTGGMAHTVPEGERASVRLGNWEAGSQAERIEYSFVVDTAYPLLMLKYLPILEGPSHSDYENPRFTMDILINGQMIGECAQVDINAGDIYDGSALTPAAVADGWHITPAATAQTDADVFWKEWTTVGITLNDPYFHGKTLTVRLTTFDCTFGAHCGYAYFTLGCSDGKLKISEDYSFEAPEGFNYRWMYASSEQYRNVYGAIPEQYVLGRERTFTVDAQDDNTYVVDCLFKQDSACFYSLRASAQPASCPIASGTCGESMTWEFDCEGVLTIAGEGKMTDYASEKEVPWDEYRASIKSVNLPEGLTLLGSNAFANCTNLAVITLPESLTAIGKRAFYNCSGLETITLPENVHLLGHNAFVGCTGLTEPVHNSHLYAYMPRTYSGAYNVPEGIVSIAAYAFADCENITSFTLPSSLVRIGVQSFANCTGLSSLTCLAVTPPMDNTDGTLQNNPFYNVDRSIPLYVLAESVDAYKDSVIWRDFTNIQAMQAEEVTETITEVETQPQDNSVIVTWPVVESADIYTLEIKKNGELICTLTFSADGRLMGIAFAAARNNHHMPAAVKTSNGGLRFTVSGLESGTTYGLDVIAKDAMNQPIKTYQTKFTTTGTTALESIQPSEVSSQKVLRNGQLFILRDGKTYTVMGQEVR